MTPSQAELGLDVSRETFERLEIYAALLRKWNRAINLVSPASLDALWTRHIADSAQVFSLAPEGAETWADLGSGGGFPGMVIAILAAELRPSLAVTLVESDKRKATFLQAVARDTGVAADIRPARIEEVSPLGAEVLSARALAPLIVLLGYAERHLAAGGVALFPKGARHRGEVAAALASWQFDVQTVASRTEADGVILRIGGISRV
ncbi:16S rRNA (guanine527-N7)-methyltransferase [Rhodovulum iodosum]|uniref:Ribosomal RNA small subunit methyltransferase G n=1 Tax=Rhodovulum iodosum TaxID=68291 RepID=A0ABV3XRN1_9RHOB|nr:16S rRNA (guanine(527)-N(7))-methyltransferase RsmG [Rhodovulum robiginosum]RSK30324.1 16S rRNA (guanine(527)-N(7))-methyltransferase RsmG [Rhodovulum robiginosum]